LVAAVGVFLPCYLFVIVPAPYYRRWARGPQIKSFVAGVTAAATGAIAGAAYVLGRLVACAAGGVKALDPAGSTVGQMKTGPGVDNIDWLPSRHLLYAASATDGTLTVAEVAANGSMKPFLTARTAPGGRSVIIDGAGTAYVPDSKGGRLLVVKVAR